MRKFMMVLAASMIGFMPAVNAQDLTAGNALVTSIQNLMSTDGLTAQQAVDQVFADATGDNSTLTPEQIQTLLNNESLAKEFLTAVANGDSVGLATTNVSESNPSVTATVVDVATTLFPSSASDIVVAASFTGNITIDAAQQIASTNSNDATLNSLGGETAAGGAPAAGAGAGTGTGAPGGTGAGAGGAGAGGGGQASTN